MIAKTLEEAYNRGARWSNEMLAGMPRTKELIRRLVVESTIMLACGFVEDELMINGSDESFVGGGFGQVVWCGLDWHVHPAMFDV